MQLALREIARAKLRFVLLSMAVGLLVFLILFQQALFGGLVTSFIGAIERQNAPVLVYGDQARRNVEASLIFPGLAEQVAAVPGVATSGPIGENTFTVDAGGELQDAAIFGYELGGLGEPTSLIEGRLPEGPGEGVASFGSDNVGFEIGDTVTVLGEQPSEITIVGVAQDARWSVQATVFVSYDTYVQAKQALDPAAQVLPSLIAVQPDDGADAATLARSITDAVDGVEALTRQQAIDENPGVRGVNSSFGIILALAFMVVVLVVGFFFLILTVQKSKPLTLLRAVGAPRRYLVQNLLGQIVVVMAAGILVGIGLTLLVGAATTGGAIDVTLDPAQVLRTVALLTVLALLGGLASVRRVLRIDPIRATVDSGSSL
ncbi:MAG: FtsX-like permease family protein [Acidimicrobiales bacterium]